MEILTNNHFETILGLFNGVKKTIKIISPFISEYIAQYLCEAVNKSGIKCQFITRFYLEDMFAKANSIDAIEMMMNAGIEMYSVKGLHTKLYLFDDTAGIIGSANFTASGFKSNIELSLLINENDLLLELQNYFDTILNKILQKENGKITFDVIKESKHKYEHLISSKKEKGRTTSTWMYGADISSKKLFINTDSLLEELDKCRHETDIVNSLFKESENRGQILYNHNIWMKQEGKGNDRLDAEQELKPNDVMLNGRTIYISNYSVNKKPVSVKDGDEVYIAALSTDSKGHNVPIIVGRGYMCGFSSNNWVLDEWITRFNWMTEYPWYCVIKEYTVLKTAIKNGISMDEVWDKLGSDTYISSFGKNEDIGEVSRKHYQKGHIRLSGNAKDYLDRRLDELKAIYGATKYFSEI